MTTGLLGGEVPGPSMPSTTADVQDQSSMSMHHMTMTMQMWFEASTRVTLWLKQWKTTSAGE